VADFSNIERGARGQAVQAALATYVRRLQHHCQGAPDNWFNFYDFWGYGTKAPTPPTESEAP